MRKDRPAPFQYVKASFILHPDEIVEIDSVWPGDVIAKVVVGWRGNTLWCHVPREYIARLLFTEGAA